MSANTVIQLHPSRGSAAAQDPPPSTHYLFCVDQGGKFSPWLVFVSDADNADSLASAKASIMKRWGCRYRVKIMEVHEGAWLYLTDGRIAVISEFSEFSSWLKVRFVDPAIGEQSASAGIATALIRDFIQASAPGNGHAAGPSGDALCRATDGVIVFHPSLVGCPRCTALLYSQFIGEHHDA